MSSENRIYLRLTDGKREQLIDWADQQGRPYTNLASWLVEKAIDAAIASGEYRPTSDQEDTTQEPKAQVDRLQSFVLALVKKQPLDSSTLDKLAADLGVEPSDLKALVKKHGQG